jgi:hypothetical protein
MEVASPGKIGTGRELGQNWRKILTINIEALSDSILLKHGRKTRRGGLKFFFA